MGSGKKVTDGVARKVIYEEHVNNDESSDDEQKGDILPSWLGDDLKKERSCKENLKEARSLVKKVFKDVKKINNRDIVEPELNDFLSTVNTFSNRNGASRVYKTADGSQAVEVPIRYNMLPKHFHNKENKTVKVVDRRKASQSVKGVVLTTHKGLLPRTRFFTHTEKNITVADTLRLSHIPYIDDNTIDDLTFIRELKNVYTAGIHGASTGCGEHINDYMMWKLLELIQDKFKEDNRFICGAIFDMFPNKCSLKDLTTGVTLMTLRERFVKEPVSENTLKTDERIGGVTSLLCPRCLVYSCPTHPDVQEEIELGPSSFPTLKEPRREKYACKNSCFLSLQETDNISIPELKSDFLKNFFRARITSSDYDLCQISEQMNIMCSSLSAPKLKCREWFALLKSYPDVPSTSQTDNKKGKKEKSDEAKADRSCSITEGEIKAQRDRFKKFTYSLAKRNMNKIDNYVMLQPCNHPGKSCKDDECDCYARGTVCTKYCRCDIDCTIKFPGCTCSPGQCGGSTCACVLANWECDPDTCLMCNCDVLTPHKPGADGAPKTLCRNINLQLGLQKKLKVGVSAVSGNGCFLNGTAKPGDLISEYTGELISQEETDRRGIIYDKFGCSYIFQLNNTTSIDAGKMGNLIRFANNDSLDPNCAARTVVVNGEQRVAVYARKEILDGEELFFNYNYNETHRNEYVGVSLHVKKKTKKEGSVNTTS